jgi:hypothetical protein
MPRDNRILIAIGAAVAVLAAVVFALFFSRGGTSSEPPPAAQGGLTVNVAEAPALDATRELRCYVAGQFVGMATLGDCASRNGLATEALDVGIDETGALVAAPTASFAPPPAEPSAELAEAPPVEEAPIHGEPAQPRPQPVAVGQCLRHSGSEWRMLSSHMSLNACVQALYSGTCVRPGDAQYGRWGDVTLRLVPRRVEQSFDNTRFRTLAEQDRSCQFPGLR